MARTQHPTVYPPTASLDGHSLRQEPAISEADGHVIIPASELSGRDVGRFVRFAEHIGTDDESRMVIIAELRQIYFVGQGDDQEVVINVATGASHEYKLRGIDPVAIYGNRVDKAPLNALDSILAGDAWG